ncbi:hypothetical protein ACLOJK_029272 [Asimina triloba]
MKRFWCREILIMRAWIWKRCESNCSYMSYKCPATGGDLARSYLESLAAYRRLWGGEMGLGLVGAAAASVCLCASPRFAMPSTKEIGAYAARCLPWPKLKTTSPIPWQNRRLKLSHTGRQRCRIEFFCMGPLTPLAYEFTRYINSEDYEGGFDMSSIEDIFSNIESNFQSWAMNFAAVAVGPTDPPSIDKYGKSLQRMKPDVALAVAKTIFLTDNRDVLEKVTVPCTIIQTANDVAVPMSACTYMHNKIGGNPSLVVIEADGHLPQLTAHRLLLDALDRILGFDCSIKDN